MILDSNDLRSRRDSDLFFDITDEIILALVEAQVKSTKYDEYVISNYMRMFE